MQGAGHVSLNKSYIGQQICIGDKTYEKGIGEICYIEGFL